MRSARNPYSGSRGFNPHPHLPANTGIAGAAICHDFFPFFGFPADGDADEDLESEDEGVFPRFFWVFLPLGFFGFVFLL